MTHSGVWGNMWDVYRVLPLQWWSSSPASRGVKVRQINRPSRPEEEKQKCPVSAMSRSFWYECWCLGVEDSRQGSTVRWPAVCQRGGGMHPLPSSCTGLEKRSIYIQDIGSVFKGWQEKWKDECSFRDTVKCPTKMHTLPQSLQKPTLGSINHLKPILSWYLNSL